MITFWIAAALLSVLVALPVLRGAARGAEAGANEEDPSLALHRRQLAEIDELTARGLLSEDDSRIARAEAGRRLLAAADASAPMLTGPKIRRVAIAAAIAAPLLGLALYLAVGSPTVPDQPFAKRVQAWQAADPNTLQPAQLAILLESHEKDYARDPDFYRTLATTKLQADDINGAAAAIRKAIALAPQRGELWAQLGQILVVGANDVVTDDAQATFEEALRLQPDLPIPHYFLGRRLIEDGKPAEGLVAWRIALPNLPEPARSELQRQMTSVEATGRLPGAVDASAAAASQGGQQVSQGQIVAMVEGLAARLKQSPNDPEGWVRLVRAYTVLNDIPKRDAALAEARTRFKDKPDVLRGLDSAAQKAQ